MKSESIVSIIVIVGILLWFLYINIFNHDDRTASRILTAQGYTNIQLKGQQWFGCSKEDITHMGFTAQINSNIVDGVVCCGFYKNCTIRFN